MVNFFKGLGLAFKNKNTVAETLWKTIGTPIGIARTHGKYKQTGTFTVPFMQDEYLTGYFSGYINFMLINCFKITNQTDRGDVMSKIYTAFDPIFFASAENFTKVMEMITRRHGKKNTTQGVDDAFMTVAFFMGAREKNEFLKRSVYLEAKKFYDSGEFDKRAASHRRAMASIMGTGHSKAQDLPENQAIAFRIMELTFVKKLNKKFKVPSYMQN